MKASEMNDKRVSRRDVLQTAAVAGLAPLIAAGPAEANLPRPGGERGYARGPHGQVHYQDNQGASAMPLLLLHQAPMSHRQFDAVYGPLKQRGVRAIGIDMPGFGMSDPTPFVPKVADWASSITAVLDHLRIRQADVLGHHTGAYLLGESYVDARRVSARRVSCHRRTSRLRCHRRSAARARKNDQ